MADCVPVERASSWGPLWDPYACASVVLKRTLLLAAPAWNPCNRCAQADRGCSARHSCAKPRDCQRTPVPSKYLKRP
jgi:hypothetical protein